MRWSNPREPSTNDMPAKSQDLTGMNGIEEKVNASELDLRGSPTEPKAPKQSNLFDSQRGLHPFRADGPANTG